MHLELRCSIAAARGCRCMPDPFPRDDLARRAMIGFDLRSAVVEYRQDLHAGHRSRLKEEPPKVMERSSPMGCAKPELFLRKAGGRSAVARAGGESCSPTLAATATRALSRSSSAPLGEHSYRELIMERNGKPLSLTPKSNVMFPIPLRCTYEW